MLLIICFFIIIIYLIVIAWLNFGFNKVEDFKLQDLEPQTKFSIVIPFRNEAHNLESLLTSIKSLNYPTSHFEVILVDDESEDDWRLILDASTPLSDQNKNNISILKNVRTSNSPKKDAVFTAIETAKYDWIITTDADCILPKYWLDTYDEFVQTKKPSAIAGPVKFTGVSSFFNRFQIIDTLSLQGTTIGSFGIKKPFMCNGANFCYSKQAFQSVNGFQNNDNIASGDDVFLLQKFILRDKGNIHFLKSEKAIVTTKVSDGFSDFLDQRLRWASKSSSYTILFPKLLGLLVLLTNLVLVGLIPLYIFGLLTLKAALLLFLIKFSIDLLLIFKASRFFKQEHVLLSYAFVSLLHPFVTFYILLQWPFKTYNWKGRSFKK